jgi:dihydrodipicolinate reductase
VRHDTTDYQCFAPGIVLSLREIGSLESGITVGLESLLGL